METQPSVQRIDGDDSCVALVTNRKYLRKCLSTIAQIRTVGEYRGVVVLVVGEDLIGRMSALEKIGLGIQPVYLGEVNTSEQMAQISSSPGGSGTELTKRFQYQKFLVFHQFFRTWKTVLYIDAGMQIFQPIEPFWEIDCTGRLIAHSDSYPDFSRTLEGQFNWVAFPNLRSELEKVAHPRGDYFQTTLMYFNTSIISASTVSDLAALLEKFPNSKTNDQGIINLWALPKGIWSPLHSYVFRGARLYDFHERAGEKPEDFILVKYPRYTKKTTKLIARVSSYYWLFCLEFWNLRVKIRRPRRMTI